MEVYMISDKEKARFGYETHFVIKEEKTTPPADYPKQSPSLQNRANKKDRSIPPLHTSYTVPFHFVESGRRNQLLICDGHKYILNNKYGEKSCKYILRDTLRLFFL